MQINKIAIEKEINDVINKETGIVYQYTDYCAYINDKKIFFLRYTTHTDAEIQKILNGWMKTLIAEMITGRSVLRKED